MSKPQLPSLKSKPPSPAARPSVEISTRILATGMTNAQGRRVLVRATLPGHHRQQEGFIASLSFCESKLNLCESASGQVGLCPGGSGSTNVYGMMSCFDESDYFRLSSNVSSKT